MLQEANTVSPVVWDFKCYKSWVVLVEYSKIFFKLSMCTRFFYKLQIYAKIGIREPKTCKYLKKQYPKILPLSTLLK